MVEVHLEEYDHGPLGGWWSSKSMVVLLGDGDGPLGGGGWRCPTQMMMVVAQAEEKDGDSPFGGGGWWRPT